MTDKICEHPQCQQKIKGDYIVTEEGWTFHTFCRSFQYEEAYQAHQAFTIWNNVMPKIDEEVINLLEND